QSPAEPTAILVPPAAPAGGRQAARSTKRENLAPKLEQAAKLSDRRAVQVLAEAASSRPGPLMTRSRSCIRAHQAVNESRQAKGTCMSANDPADRMHHLSVRLSVQAGAAALTSDHVATLTVTCPREQQEASLLRYPFLEHSDGMTLNLCDDSLRLRCRGPARRSSRGDACARSNAPIAPNCPPISRSLVAW